MSAPAYPLDRPLPPDVAAGEATFLQFYQKFAVFSWPWAWRRTAVFGTLTALAGASFGISHGLLVKSGWEAVTVGLTCAAGNAVLVGAGPVLAALVRHTNLSRRVESLFVVASVICGMALAVFAGKWASNFHDALMVAHGMHGTPPPVGLAEFHSFVRRLMNEGYELLVLFIAAGGLALPTYFAEPKRWAEHSRRLELEKMSLQKNEADLRLTVLQAQVEPHFLFNTLASVRSLVSTDPQRASQTIDALAQHLRATLPKLRAETGATHSTLEEQFAICASYLDLMRLRLGERLRVDIHLPPELREVPFPPLLLLSLVENAIKHGVEPKPGLTHVVLAARVLDEGGRKQLEVQVEDDGAGLKLGLGEGTGLANIRAQLRTRFASAASFDLSGRSTGGVVARLLLPLEAEPGMSSPSALIAEDELPQREELRALLRELWPDLNIVAECEHGLAALEALEQHRPQVAFLDIRMPGVSGLEVARAAGAQCQVIFTTAYEEYALRAFDEGAVDYLLKPIARERLSLAIERARSRLSSGTRVDMTALIDMVQAQLRAGKPKDVKWITASVGNSMKMYSIDEVLFFQAQDKYTRVVTADSEGHIRTPLKELLPSLDSETFWQVHRSVIVRVGAIRAVEKDADGKLALFIRGRPDVLPVSSAFQHRFRGM